MGIINIIDTQKFIDLTALFWSLNMEWEFMQPDMIEHKRFFDEDEE
jgi:hypothetical protein